jgi:hypothetical protein
VLTIFSIPKPFKEHIGIIQRNAIESWTRLTPVCEVMLFGDEAGVAEAAQDLKVQHVPQVARNDYGTPLLDSVFAKAKQAAQYPILCYVNADIILLNDFLDAIQRIGWPEYLLVGQRWDLEVLHPLSFEVPGWAADLKRQVQQEGVLHPASGSDFFVYPKSGRLDLTLPFAVGRPIWDNWFIYEARRLGVAVVDLSEVTTVIHQNHDYQHVAQQRTGKWEGPEADINRKLVGSWARAFRLEDATHQMTATAIRSKWGWRYGVRHLETLPELWPPLAPLSAFWFETFRWLRRVLAAAQFKLGKK